MTRTNGYTGQFDPQWLLGKQAKEKKSTAGSCRPWCSISRLFCAAPALFLLLMCGCGSGVDLEWVAVSGKVTLDGAPLENGTITFTSQPVSRETAMRTMASPIVDGEYSISASNGPAKGPQKVSIIAQRAKANQKIRAKEMRGNEVGDQLYQESLERSERSPEMEQYLPDKFNTETTLKCELEDGSNSGTNFDLKLEADESEL